MIFTALSLSPLTSVDLSSLLYQYQRNHVENPARFTWSNWSRQVGKSFASSLRRILRGMARRKNQIFLSAGATQSRELMMKAKQHLDAMRIAASGIVEGDEEIFGDVKYKQLEIAIPELGPGGGPLRIIGLPANPRTARGFTGDLLLDEFAMHKQDREIYGAAFPTVSRDGGELDVCSTPQGKQNLFYELASNDLFDRSTVTIYDAVSQGCPQDIEVLRRGITDEEKWRQEFMCEFVDEATAFLTYEQILECEKSDLPRMLDVQALATMKSSGPILLPFDERWGTGDVVVGIDVGRKKDLTVIWAFEIVDRMMQSLGLLELDRVSFAEQFDIIAGVLRARCVRRCAIDASGLGMQMGEELQKYFGEHRLEACTFTGPFKEQIASLMRNKFTDKLIRIPVDSEIRNDLHSVRKIVTAAGNVRLEAPREGGSHADRFWACALACYAAGGPMGRIEVVMGPRRSSPW